MKPVTDISPTLGCDPEFFFRRKGEVVGAETVLPKDGLKAGTAKFIIDGVQAELNPAPDTCRARFGNNIALCFRTLHNELSRSGGDITADFSRTVEISKDELMKLKADSRKFGCAPSQNIYKAKSGLKIKDVDPEVYRTRAAGGHIHLGHAYHAGAKRALTTDVKKTVALLDILCGNTSVLVDRDPSNIERRKVYGQAGEHRLPEHGLEYRTLSNYWLTAYPLMSFAFGMARLALQLMADDNHDEYYKAFTSRLKASNIYKAINKNDYDLAMRNFEAISALIVEVTAKPSERGRHPINKWNIREFLYFSEMIEKNGLEHWFKQDPMTHWRNLGDGHYHGFHDFTVTTVKQEMKNNAAVAKALRLKKAA